jgi:hypothetical protein
MVSRNRNGKDCGSSEPLKPAEPPEEVLIPDIYAEYNREPELMLKDEPSVKDEAEGFNPYDTAVLYKN